MSSTDTPREPVPYSFGAAWDLGIQTFRARYALLLGMTGVAFAVHMPVSVLRMLWWPERPDGEGPGAYEANLARLGLFAAANVLVSLPLLFGAAYAAAEASEGRGRALDILLGFRRYGRSLVGALAVQAAFIALAAAACLPAWAALRLGLAESLGAGWIALTLILMLAAILLTVTRVLPGAVAAIDPTLRMGLAETFRFSQAATRGRFLSMSTLVLATMAVSHATILLCGIGYLLIGIPLLFAMLGATYRLAIRNAPRA